VTTFLARFAVGEGDAPRVAVKDCIDVAGTLTTNGSPSVADDAVPADADAACVSAVRAAGAVLVGKTNLHELCFGSTGVNPWYGTPKNPLDPDRIPGGSSSGSAVAVAEGEADLALGTDTTGSVRTPAACCGVAALKTTWGRLPLGGVAALAPSLDTVGFLSVGVARLAEGMAMVEPAFRVDPSPPALTIGRLRGVPAEPVIDAAVDAALAAAEVHVVDVELPLWHEAAAAARTVLFGEAWAALGHLYRDHRSRIGDEVRGRFELAAAVTDAALAEARAWQAPWQAELADVLGRVDAIALPAFPDFAPLIVERDVAPNPLAAAISLAGNPAVAMPVPVAGGGAPASLQLVGLMHGEAALLAVAGVLEAAVGAGPFAR
jgi:amidase